MNAELNINKIMEWENIGIPSGPGMTLLPVKTPDNQWGVINQETGDIIIAPFSPIPAVIDEVIRVNDGNLWAFFDTKGVQLTDFIFEEIGVGGLVSEPDDPPSFVYAVKLPLSLKYALFDPINNVYMTDFDYDMISPPVPYSEVCIYAKNHKIGLINVDGIEITEPLYENVLDFNPLTSPAKRDGKWGILNIKGEEVLPCEHKIVDPVAGIFFAVYTKENSIAVYDPQGNLMKDNLSEEEFKDLTDYLEIKVKEKGIEIPEKYEVV